MRRRGLTTSDWYTMATISHFPMSDKDIPKIAAWYAKEDGISLVPDSVQASIEKLIARGWLCKVSQSFLDNIKSHLAATPLYGLPEVDDIDFTEVGAYRFKQISPNLTFSAEAWIEGEVRTIYTHWVDRAKEIGYEISARGKSDYIIESVGPWSIHWWNSFERGYRIIERQLYYNSRWHDLML